MECKDLVRLLKQPLEEGENEHLTSQIKQLEEYFTGNRKEFSVPLVTPGTDFQHGSVEGTSDNPLWTTPDRTRNRQML